MGFTSDACWFLLLKSLLMKNNKKREAALKMKRAGTRNVFFLTWPYFVSRYLATGQSEIVLGKTHPIVLKAVL